PEAVVLQAQDSEAGAQLREGARRGRTRDDGPAATRQDARRWAVPDVDRVLRLPGGGSARPPRLGLEAADRREQRAGPTCAGLGHGCRLADRADARLRRRERADARLGLLGRRLRPLRPPDDL